MRLMVSQSSSASIHSGPSAAVIAKDYAQSSQPAPASVTRSRAAAGETAAERAPRGNDEQIWYAIFLSAFLIGLLVLGGFWIWFNIRFA